MDRRDLLRKAFMAPLAIPATIIGLKTAKAGSSYVTLSEANLYWAGADWALSEHWTRRDSLVRPISRGRFAMFGFGHSEHCPLKSNPEREANARRLVQECWTKGA